ncbi:MAG: hypothetical protein HOE90_12605 [Bacteriovoracaceae bacterium]|nr:hypothetical protein [Bacteriovoracaceae bacterium]
MKVAIVGTGKSGGLLTQLINQGDIVGPFNSKNPPTPEALSKADVIITFTSAEVFASLVPIFLESKTPVVSAATGFDYSSELAKTIKDQKLKWLYASNFSMGVNLLRRVLKTLNAAKEILNSPSIRIEETHHIHKLDAPSGTALSMKDWLGLDAEMISHREGDVVGIHTLLIESEYEMISLTHKAKNRKLFASGAIWAAEYFCKNIKAPGLYSFDDVLDDYFETLQETHS